MTSPQRQQYTIATPTKVTGFGFWSGQDVQLEFRPAKANTGIVFVRRDLGSHVRIPARVQYRIESPRRTTLTRNGASIELVEHVMAALAGLQIDNCEVWADAAEMPGVDGSSQPFVTALQRAGRIEQSVVRPCLIVTEPVRVGTDEAWIEARPTAGWRLSADYKLDYGRNHPIGRQSLKIDISPDTFVSQLASARTFIMREEAEWLHRQGLALRVSASDVLVFDQEHGVVDNQLRYDDECVRHKVLDVMGDLALAGCDLVGHVIAYRSGHRLNAALVQALLAEGQIRYDWRAIA